MNEDKEKRQVAWSMDEAQLREIAKLIAEASEVFKQRQYSECMGVLQTLKLQFIHSCSDEEKEELARMEKDSEYCVIAGMLKKKESQWEDDRDVPEERLTIWKKILRLYYGKLGEKTELYFRKVMELLDTYGYLAKKKKDKKKLGM